MTDPIKRLRQLCADETRMWHLYHNDPQKARGIGCRDDAWAREWQTLDETSRERADLAMLALPALLNALELYRHVAESARDQMGNDFLWEKWGHPWDMQKAEAAMAALEKLK